MIVLEAVSSKEIVYKHWERKLLQTTPTVHLSLFLHRNAYRCERPDDTKVPM